MSLVQIKKSKMFLTQFKMHQDRNPAEAEPHTNMSVLKRSNIKF